MTMFFFSWTGKIFPSAVQEGHASRHNYALIEDPFQGNPNYAPMMPRNASLSDGCTSGWCIQRKLFGILLIQTEIRLWLPFSYWFGSKRMSVWIQINRKRVNTIWFRVDLTRFQKVFSVLLLLGSTWVRIAYVGFHVSTNLRAYFWTNWANNPGSKSFNSEPKSDYIYHLPEW